MLKEFKILTPEKKRKRKLLLMSEYEHFRSLKERPIFLEFYKEMAKKYNYLNEGVVEFTIKRELYKKRKNERAN